VIQQYDIERAKLLAEAKALVAKAVKAGLMSYPLGVKLDITGTPINVIDPDYQTPSRIHTPELCLKAYELRELGLCLDDVARQCGLPKGSIVYVISKGHELFLARERAERNAANSVKESP
jgi:hypothetical protein